MLIELDSLIREKAPLTYAELEPGLLSEEIVNLESAYGLVIPDDLRSLYSWHDGRVCLAPLYFFLGLQEMLDNYKENCALDGDILDWSPSFLPVFENGGNYYAYDTAGLATGRQGQIVFWFHEMAQCNVETFSLRNLLFTFVEGWKRGYFVEDSDSPRGISWRDQDQWFAFFYDLNPGCPIDFDMFTALGR